MPFQIVRNDITKMNVDAIVNPANPRPEYGAGIDSAVYRAAGESGLLEARRQIGDIAVGESVVTPGFALPAKYIIHSVGTFWRGGSEGEEDVIRSCYRTSFECALELGLQSIAFPLLASGSYGFPKNTALKIALSEINAFLDGQDMAVYLVVFDGESFTLSGEMYGDIDSYIDENYVETVQRDEYTAPEPDRRRLFANSVMARPSMAMPSPDFMQAKSAGRRVAKKSENREEALGAMCMDEEADVDEVRPAKKPRSLDDVILNLDKTFMELVFTFADQRGITDVELQRRANLDKRTYSKLKCGTTKKPSQTTALALAIGLKLNLDDTKDLLSRAGLALSPCSRLDLIVQYFIEREVYDIDEINIALFDHGEPQLGSVVNE